MTQTLADLHVLARDAGVPRYRSLARAELLEALGLAVPHGTAPTGPELASPEREEEAPQGPIARLRRLGTLALIELDDRARRNAISMEMVDLLDACLAEVEADEEIRCVAVTGRNGIFSSGADLAALAEDDGLVLVERMRQICDRLSALPLPVVALVDGPAVGGGAELALACDWRLLSDEGELRFPHVGLGLVPGFGGIGRLRSIVGPTDAFRILALRGRLEARLAFDIGLADDVMPARMLEARARSLADALALGDRDAIGAIKRTLQSDDPGAEAAAFRGRWQHRKLPTATPVESAS